MENTLVFNLANLFIILIVVWEQLHFILLTIDLWLPLLAGELSRFMLLHLTVGITSHSISHYNKPFQSLCLRFLSHCCICYGNRLYLRLYRWPGIFHNLKVWIGSHIRLNLIEITFMTIWKMDLTISHVLSWIVKYCMFSLILLVKNIVRACDTEASKNHRLPYKSEN